MRAALEDGVVVGAAALPPPPSSAGLPLRQGCCQGEEK